jgi:hypothetical protein
MDEVHFQQHGSRCRMWVPPEIRDPVYHHAPTRKSISYFGAVRIGDGKLVASKPEGRFDAETCWRFLRKLRRAARRRADTGRLRRLTERRSEKGFPLVVNLRRIMFEEQALIDWLNRRSSRLQD